MNLELHAKILKLRSILNQVSDVSFQFRQLNEKHRLQELTEDDAKHLVTIYEDLILQVMAATSRTKK